MTKQQTNTLKYEMSFILCFLFYTVYGQSSVSYDKAYTELSMMLEDKKPADLALAVYSIENAWYDGKLNRTLFNHLIDEYTTLCSTICHSDIIRYTGKDEQSLKAQAAVFFFMTDTIPVLLGDSIIYHTPFQYNYKDFAGQKDWSSMFVSTLMITRKGNCHSMPLLYKLIMNKLGEKCWLALAPNHLYLKAYTEKSRLYNIELTTGNHPTDAWIAASGYIHLDAIRNSLYMDSLTVKEEIALCLVDLAQGYDRKYPDNDGIFVWDCCETALKYYPNYINALLIQAELITRTYLAEKEKNSEQAVKLKEEMNRAYSQIHKLGYRKMPEKMYRTWIRSLSEQNKENINYMEDIYH